MARTEKLAAAPALVAALGLAVLLTATSGEYGPEVAQVFGPMLTLLGLVLLGRAAGWPSLPLMTVCVVAVGYLGSALFYDDQADVPPDLRVSGMDEIGRDPASVVILLPAVWLVLVVAVLSRRWSGRPSRPLAEAPPSRTPRRS